MKFFTTLLCLLSIAVGIEAQTLNQSLLFDFGPNDVTNGNITVSPDANSNYWNCPTNATTAATPLALITKTNAATTFTLTVTANMTTNGIVSGGLLAPSSALLGEFAINTATQDYFFTNTTGSFKIGGLNPANGYKFYMFGSRSTTETRVAQYTFVGLTTTSGTLQTSGTNLGGTGVNGNTSSIYVTDYLYPDASGNISITISKASGTYAHLNVMKVEEFNNMPFVDVASIAVSGNDITQSGATSQMSASVLPANATIKEVNWSVDNKLIATIDANGILHPVANGTVTVTATTKQSTLTTNASKLITVSNQITSLYFSGDATESGTNLATATPMKMVTDANNTATNIFEIYTSLSETGTFVFNTTQDALTTSTYALGATAGSLEINGTPIDPLEIGTVLITVNLTTNSYTILPIAKWSIVGNTIPNAWSGDVPLTYQGNGIWSGTIDMLTATTEYQRFIFRANDLWSYSIKRIKGTANKVMMESQATPNGIVLEDIGLDNGTFNITLNLRDYTYAVTCASINEMKIIQMGSSVANGQGATNMQGYGYQISQLLAQRQSLGLGGAFEMANVSINGNNTTNLLDRWEKDVIGSCGKYVIYAVSLGNEGIHEKGQPSFDSYLANMQLLIEKARAKGKIPIVTNSYTRADFNATDYNYIKQMDLLIHEWDVPSINLLGAIDDGTGKWSVGYDAGDIYHPNDAGHAELFYAFVPSLFDALEAGKPLPTRTTGTFVSINNESTTKQVLEFTPENVIHSFTTSFDIKTTSAGTIASFNQAELLGEIRISDATGAIEYTSPNGGSIAGSIDVRDGQWHKVTLTHFYARGETLLYCDDNQLGTVSEKLLGEIFSLNDLSKAPLSIDYRDWFFYRAGMNSQEVAALNDGHMLKSSLELYAPLDGEAKLGNDILVNLALSNNAVTMKTITPTTISNNKLSLELNISPNPVTTSSNIAYTLPSSGNVDITLFDLAGNKIVNLEHNFLEAGNHIISWETAIAKGEELKEGVYLCRLQSPMGNKSCKIVLSY